MPGKRRASGRCFAMGATAAGRATLERLGLVRESGHGRYVPPTAAPAAVPASPFADFVKT